MLTCRYMTHTQMLVSCTNARYIFFMYSCAVFLHHSSRRTAKMKFWIIASSIIDDAKVAKRVTKSA